MKYVDNNHYCGPKCITRVAAIPNARREIQIPAAERQRCVHFAVTRLQTDARARTTAATTTTSSRLGDVARVNVEGDNGGDGGDDGGDGGR